MDNGEKNRIPEYEADYRDMNPRRPDTGKVRRKKSEPHSGKSGGSPKSPMPKADGKRAAAPARKRRPAEKSGTVPQKDRPARERKSAPPAEIKSGPMDNDTEIDDFLPKEDHADGEKILTRWESEPLPKESPSSSRAGRRHGKHRYGIFAGTLVLLFALIGVGYISVSLGSRVHSALTDDSAQRAYDRFLTVVVAQDPQAFVSPDKADPEFVLNASIWQTMSENASDYTSYDDEGRTLVPLGDVSDACRELFGPNCKLQPKNPKPDTFFTYDSDKAQFHVSMYSLDSTYEPYTEKAAKTGEGTVLRVGYIPPSDPTRAESGVSSAGTPKPSKYMEYVLKTDPSTKKEYIYSVRKEK